MKQTDNEFIISFLMDNIVSSGITLEIVEQIKNLVEEYKLSHIRKDCSIINADYCL